MIRQTRIFIPLNTPFDQGNWAETVFGRIIRPTVKGGTALNWYWFSRYNCPATMDSDDCDITKIPDSFMVPNNKHYRSIRFRYSIPDSECASFEEHCQSEIDQNNCRVSDFRKYDVVGDLGSDRHIGGERSSERRRRRADVIARLYWMVSQLALDSLAEPDAQGRFSFEHNDSHPLNSSFEAPHHVFCNITDVPLRVLISQTAIGTDYAPPHNPVQAVQVRF
ncbi:MAG: hypothetical protein ABIJ25_06115 [Pseudomonadota bacterium]